MAPEHDGLTGKNVISSKGSYSLFRDNELDENMSYLKSRLNKEKIVSLIVGGPNKYYDYKTIVVEKIFNKIKLNFIDNGLSINFYSFNANSKKCNR